jgi:glycosyltransferase 2 family protein
MVADRRSLGLWFRIAASLVMLGLLLPRVHFDTIVPEWDRGTAAWLVAAALATLAGIVASALRWQAVLAGLDIHARARTLLHHYLAGLFVGNFLPSTIGGDVLRVRRLAIENGEGADTFASVVLERLTGMLVLPVITLVALALNPGLRHLGTSSVVAFVMSVSAIALLVVILWMVSHPSIGGRLTGSGKWKEFAGAVHLGAARFRRHPEAAIAVLVAAFAYQLLVVLAAFCAARAVDLDQLGITACLAFIPAVAMAQTVPISLGGLGIREGALVLFLHPLGVSTGRAVAIGLLVYGLNLAVSLLGAPSFALGGPRRKVAA